MKLQEILYPVLVVARTVSALGRHVNAASRKSLKIQAYSITEPRTHSEQKKKCMNISFQLLLYIMSGINSFVV